MAKALRALGYRVGRRQARKLMREACVWVRYRCRYRVTTDSNHRKPVLPNRLERDSAPSAPSRVWAGDITYIWTREGWLCLAAVIDLYSRESATLTKKLISRACAKQGIPGGGVSF